MKLERELTDRHNSLIYVFGVFSCEEYYKTHDDPGPIAGRCRLAAIEANAAQQVAILGMGTTLFGVANLFFTGWMIKRFGLKNALFTSVLWPAVRLAVQNLGVQLGAGTGILVIQLSQIMTLVGGPVGYILALNSFAAEVVAPAERTAVLGRVTGLAMFGSSVAYLLGGYLSDTFGIAAPFRFTLGLFLLSSIYIFLFLPNVEAPSAAAGVKTVSSFSAFVAPLKLYVPTKWIQKDGKTRTEYGVLLLGAGAFLGVLATGFQTILLQLFATDVLEFGTTENGWLISLNTGFRGVFLTFMFPAIIAGGRRWLDKGKQTEDKTSDNTSTVQDGTTVAPELEVSTVATAAMTEPPPAEIAEIKREESFRFDLVFTTWSILLDGVLTGVATFVTTGWQLYLLAIILPFASGTGPAAKGTILQMCSPSQRADALSAISLVELCARLVTQGLFGAIFAAFATIGRPELTFVCNAGVASLAFVVLLFARFPPEGSRRAAEVAEER